MPPGGFHPHYLPWAPPREGFHPGIFYSPLFPVFSFFSFLGYGWSAGKDLLHYQHCFTQILNEFLLGKGLPGDFQPMPIEKHGDGFFIDSPD